MSVVELAREASLGKSFYHLDEKTSNPRSPSLTTNDSSSGYNVKSDLKALDVAIELAAGYTDDVDVSPKEFRRLRNKLDKHILPLFCAAYAVQFIDHNTLAASAILGIMTDNNLTTDQFTTLGSAFYIGFLIFQWPHNLALQRLPVGKWMSFNILLWRAFTLMSRIYINVPRRCIFLGLHPLCHNFGELFVLRFFLGASEGCITAGLMLVTSMFYTRTEIAERQGWIFQCNGVGTIISGFFSFAAFQISANSRPNQWQWLFIINTILTFVVFVLFALYFPDNPTTAHFLTKEEKLEVVKRVQENHNGIETKVWKKNQFIDALLDAKTWLFFLFAVVTNLASGFGVQYSLIIQSFGFTTLQTTLLTIPSGVAQILGVTSCMVLVRKSPNCRTRIAIQYLVPSLLPALLEICLPQSNKVGHLCAIYILNFGSSPAFVLVMAWTTSTVAGHTKKLTTNAVFLVGYGLGQTLGQQFWKDQYKPRYLVPWIILLVSFCANIIIVLAIRYVLSTENKRRDALQVQAEASGDLELLAKFDDFGYIVTVDEHGNKVKKRVDKSLLDMTDKENLAFRSVL